MVLNSKFVFFGSPEFASLVLEKLIEASHVPEIVICNPDRPTGRKQAITPPPVKSSILNRKAQIPLGKIKIFQPEKLDSSFKFQVSRFKPDFFVVAAYAKIIAREILAIPRLGTIGVHPSLLPKYRGASPVQSAILNGEAETGVTLYLMDEKMDHGPILEARRLKIENGITYPKLQKQLAELSGDLLVETLPKFIAGKIKPLPQDESKATSTKKFRTEDAFLDYNDLLEAEAGNIQQSEKIDRMIRAFLTEPGVWTIKDSKRVKLLESEIQGTRLRLKKIQVEGKKPQAL